MTVRSMAEERDAAYLNSKDAINFLEKIMKDPVYYDAAINDLATIIRLARDINKTFPAYRIPLNPLKHKMNALKIAREHAEQNQR